MEIIKAKTKFKKTTDQEIDLALADPNFNEIGQEIARLINGYTKNLAQFIHQKGHIPESILRKKGSCPIEERAIQLVLNEFKNEGQGMSETRTERDFSIGYNVGLDALDTLEEKGAPSTEAIAGILSVVMHCLYSMAPSEEMAEEIISISQKQALDNWHEEMKKNETEGKE